MSEPLTPTQPATTAPLTASEERRRRKKMRTETPPLLQSQDRFQNRWVVEGIIGKGGFGQIYLANDVIRGEDVAIKVEAIRANSKVGYAKARRMVLEQAILVKLQGKPHVPPVYASGSTETVNFIVMQCLSVNLSELRRRCPGKRMCLTTAGRVLFQLVSALKDVHEAGFVHRDVKPGNVCFGVNPENQHTLYLLDFGMARRYLEPDGSWRKQRSHVSIRGTRRYISTRVHQLHEQTPHDDMYSAFYSVYELVAGSLPWAHFADQGEVFHFKNEMALPISRKEYFENELESFIPFLDSLTAMSSQSALLYTEFLNIAKSWYDGKKTMEDLFEWEELSEQDAEVVQSK